MELHSTLKTEVTTTAKACCLQLSLIRLIHIRDNCTLTLHLIPLPSQEADYGQLKYFKYLVLSEAHMVSLLVVSVILMLLQTP